MKRDITEFVNTHPAVMLARNAIELTKRAVASVLAQDIPVHLHVIDNNSTDGTMEFLGTQLPRVTFETFRPGLGVSASWNTALTTVFRKYDHCLVLNNDIELRPDTYRSLLDDGGPFVTAVSVDNPAAIQGEWRKAPRPHPDFSCFLIRRDVWQKVGLFDESMVLYASDADYHLRMHQAGIEAYTIGIPFYHYASGTLKSSTELDRREIQAQADRDRARFMEKWGCRVGSPEYYKMFGTEAP